jgi:site-specific recombinase XerD
MEQDTKNRGSSRVYLTFEEVRNLISSIKDSRDQLILKILYETGCSQVELTKIRVKNVGGNKISVKERDNIRYANISGKLAKEISQYILGNKLEKDSFLLSTRQGGSITEKRVRQLIHNYSQKAGFGKINPVSFRYFHIAHAYQCGVFIETIAVQLGLTKLRIFQIINELDITPRASYYSQFLGRV